VLFAYDSYQIAPSEVAKVEKVAEFMRRATDVKLVAEGHCDERGSNEYNMSLGEHRALAVRAHLISLGIDGSRIQTRSFGEEKPLNSGHGESAWRENRRVEFALFR
jgi:peptidoglycan-associated lipoprotein